MKSRLPKPAHRLLGKPFARYPLDALRACGVERCVVVVGHGAELVREALGAEVDYAVQAQARGTGDALLSARATLSDFAGAVVVLQSDNVLLTAEDVRNLLTQHQASAAAATFLTAIVPDPAAYGRVVRDAEGHFSDVVEAKACTPEQLEISEINVGAYVLDATVAFEALAALTPNPVTGEIYLTDLFGDLRRRGLRVETATATSPEAALGVNDRIEQAHAAGILRRRILQHHMLNGVTIEDPNATYIDADVRIEPDTTIHPMTFLHGATVIGEGCEIGPGARITNCTLGEGVSVQFAVLADSTVADGTKIGPYAQLRPGSRVGRKVKIGNFVELKNATVADRASIGHFAYMGDADVGEHTNIGAGTITCNYDGKRKHRTKIGAEAFIGTHTTLVAPVSVGDGAFTAAGTVVTHDVPEDALAVGRTRQENKPGWAKRRREVT